jgi:hypothetical protein
MEAPMTQLSQNTRALLAQVRVEDHMSSADKARIRGGLAQKIRMGVAAGAAVTLGTSVAEAMRSSVLGSQSPWSPLAAKVVAAVAITTAVGVGTVRLTQSRHEAATQPHGVKPSHGGKATGAAAAPAVGNIGVPTAQPSNETLMPTVPVEGSTPTPTAPAPTKGSTSAVTPASSSETEAVNATLNPSTVSAPNMATQDDRASASDGLLAEISAVMQARAALRNGNAQRALQIINSIQRSGTFGTFDQESALIRVQAYCGLGNRAAARDIASRFLAQYPESPLAAKMREGCHNSKP